MIIITCAYLYEVSVISEMKAFTIGIVGIVLLILVFVVLNCVIRDRVRIGIDEAALVYTNYVASEDALVLTSNAVQVFRDNL